MRATTLQKAANRTMRRNPRTTNRGGRSESDRGIGDAGKSAEAYDLGISTTPLAYSRA